MDGRCQCNRCLSTSENGAAWWEWHTVSNSNSNTGRLSQSPGNGRRGSPLTPPVDMYEYPLKDIVEPMCLSEG